MLTSQQAEQHVLIGPSLEKAPQPYHVLLGTSTRVTPPHYGSSPNASPGRFPGQAFD
jgi:hypothetical protein